MLNIKSDEKEKCVPSGVLYKHDRRNNSNSNKKIV